jgi:hypothetical protein
MTSHFGKIIFPSTNQEIEGCWLRLDSEKPFLEVPCDSFQCDYWDFIIGTFSGLDNVTFYKCDLGGGRGGKGGSYRRIYFSCMFEHIAINEKNELAFFNVSFNSKALETWGSENVLQLDFEELTDSLCLRVPNRIVLHKVLTHKGDIEITQGFERQLGSSMATIRRETTISIEFKEKTHFDQIELLLLQIKRLILFITHESPQIDSFNFSNGAYRPIVMQEKSRFNSISGFSVGLQLDYFLVKPYIERVIKNWIENEKMFQIIELIQENYMTTTLSFQNYFLNCCVAVESFHVRFIKGNVTNDVKQNIKCRTQGREFISSIIHDEDIRNTFLNNTTNWKTTSFKEKLSHFSEAINRIKGQHITIPSDEFIDKLVKTRNKIAHEGDYLKYLTEFELLLFGKVLEQVVKIEILKLLGIDNIQTLDEFYLDATYRVDSLARMNNYNINN